MITMTQIMLNINSPGAKEPKSVVNLFITIIMDPTDECLPKKRQEAKTMAEGQNIYENPRGKKSFQFQDRPLTHLAVNHEISLR